MWPFWVQGVVCVYSYKFLRNLRQSSCVKSQFPKKHHFLLHWESLSMFSGSWLFHWIKFQEAVFHYGTWRIRDTNDTLISVIIKHKQPGLGFLKIVVWSYFRLRCTNWLWDDLTICWFYQCMKTFFFSDFLVLVACWGCTSNCMWSSQTYSAILGISGRVIMQSKVPNPCFQGNLAWDTYPGNQTD